MCHQFQWSYCWYWYTFMELTQQDVSPIPRIILFNVRIDNTLMKLTQQDVSTIVIGLRLFELNTYHGLSRCDITDISMISCMSLIWFLIKYQFNKSHAGITDHGRHCFLLISCGSNACSAKVSQLITGPCALTENIKTKLQQLRLRGKQGHRWCVSAALSISLSSLTQSPTPHPVLPR